MKFKAKASTVYFIELEESDVDELMKDFKDMDEMVMQSALREDNPLASIYGLLSGISELSNAFSTNMDEVWG